MTKPTLNVTEAADILKVHAKTVEDLIRNGAIPAGKVGRSWVMMTEHVLAHAEKVIMAQTADRLRGRSPKRISQRRSAKVRVAHQHAV
jgi:excisionase family DNA binding protein